MTPRCALWLSCALCLLACKEDEPEQMSMPSGGAAVGGMLPPVGGVLPAGGMAGIPPAGVGGLTGMPGNMAGAGAGAAGTAGGAADVGGMSGGGAAGVAGGAAGMAGGSAGMAGAGMSGMGGAGMSGMGGAGMSGMGGAGMAGMAGGAGMAGTGMGSAATFTEVYGIIMAKCGGGSSGCHIGGSSGMLRMPDKATARTNLVGMASRECPGEMRVVAGNAAMSVLVKAIEGNACFARMPRGRAALSAAEIDKFKSWINAGAMNN